MSYDVLNLFIGHHGLIIETSISSSCGTALTGWVSKFQKALSDSENWEDLEYWSPDEWKSAESIYDKPDEIDLSNYEGICIAFVDTTPTWSPGISGITFDVTDSHRPKLCEEVLAWNSCMGYNMSKRLRDYLVDKKVVSVSKIWEILNR